jgi:hypothetical protein
MTSTLPSSASAASSPDTGSNQRHPCWLAAVDSAPLAAQAGALWA